MNTTVWLKCPDASWPEAIWKRPRAMCARRCLSHSGLEFSVAVGRGARGRHNLFYIDFGQDSGSVPRRAKSASSFGSYFISSRGGADVFAVLFLLIRFVVCGLPSFVYVAALVGCVVSVCFVDVRCLPLR